MSASHLPDLDAIGLQLVGLLDAYDSATALMLRDWPDLDTYRDASALVEKIRPYCSSLPEVRVQWVELLIAHAELVHFLWRLQHGDQRTAESQLQQACAHHADCIVGLRNRTRRLLARGGQGQALPGLAGR
jgi:hypothetical protein